jgi:hypothetical protein
MGQTGDRGIHSAWQQCNVYRKKTKRARDKNQDKRKIRALCMGQLTWPLVVECTVTSDIKLDSTVFRNKFLGGKRYLKFLTGLIE